MAEPEWDQYDRDLVTAHAGLDRCPVCGGMASECQDPANQDLFKAEAYRCHRITAQLDAQSRMTERSNPHMQALAWRVSLLDTARLAGVI